MLNYKITCTSCMSNKLLNYEITCTSCTCAGSCTRLKPGGDLPRVTEMQAWRPQSHTINRIQAFINKSKRFGYCSQSCEPLTLCEQADDNLFRQIIINENLVLHHLIPKTKTHDHYVRIRSHNFQLPIKGNRNFINKCLFKGIS